MTARAAPFTDAELDKIREVNPLWPSYAWLATVDALKAQVATLTAERDALEAHGTGDDRALHYDAICRTIGRDPCTDRAVDDIDDLFAEIKRHESPEDVYPEDTVARLARERAEALKVADVATDAAAKAVLDAKEVYEVRHLKRIAELEKALAWYADDINYQDVPHDRGYYEPNVVLDEGERARKALSKEAS